MSLIRQIWLVLLTSVLLAIAGTTAVNLASAGRYLKTQLQLKNSDNASTLALAMSQQHGDLELMKLLLAAQFDTGSYQRIQLVATDGKVLYERDAPSNVIPTRAPAWFVRLVDIEPPAGLAKVPDGWSALGSVEVASTVAYAYDELWKSSVGQAVALVGVGLLVGLLGTLGLWRIGRAVDATVRQAGALVDGEFITVPEPRAPELARLTRAMNSMVTRLKTNFDAQAAQLDSLHRLAHCDALTELANRGFFLRQLQVALEREDGPQSGGLVLLRLRDLAGINQGQGRDKADRLLKHIALALRPYGDRVDGCIVGRLNGSDFGLFVPVGGMVLETAQTVMQVLSNLLTTEHPGVTVAAGALEVRHGTPMARVMADVDAALARAESLGGYAVELGSEQVAGPGEVAAGEGTWREQLGEALQHGRAKLVHFPLIDAKHQLIHLETPLRLQLVAGGVYEVASHWLPLAVRSRLTAAADQRAVALALDAITEDGLSRCVNISAASLADSGFAARLRALMFGGPQAARRLWLEVPETAAIEHFALLQELGRQLRPCGVKLGLEHAGARLRQIDRLLEAGLDFVKLDASTVDGVAADAKRAQFVRGLIALLHGLSIKVFAEGVSDDGDARVLWNCGLDGITGPLASAHRHDLVQS